MFKNFLKVTLRNILRQKFYAVINITGLAVGIACSILITIFILYETGYDRFHDKADRIYRLYVDGKMMDQEMLSAWTPVPAGPAFQAEIPEIELATRLNWYSNVFVKRGEDVFIENGLIFVDSAFFSIFSFPLISGDPLTVLNEPNSIVISEEMAGKYFGEEDPVGQSMHLFSGETDYIVTGIMGKIPDQSHLKFDFAASYSSLGDSKNTEWTSNNVYTYLMLAEGADPDATRSKMKTVQEKYVGPEIMKYIGIPLEEWLAAGNRYGLDIQPLNEVHLDTDIAHGLMVPSSNKRYIYIFSVIALFIIIIACINFMNLSTARSAMRAREVGIRKSSGSSRGSLIWQFLAESFIMTFIGLLVALIIVELCLPGFNRLTGLSLVLSYTSEWFILPGLLLFALLTGLVSGSYPAFILASFNPVRVLSGKPERNGPSGKLRSLLVVLQFSISIFIILGTIVVYLQLSYMQNRDLGFNKDQLVVLERFSVIGGNKIETFKQEIAKLPGVLSSASSTMVPGYSNNNNGYMMEGRPADEVILMNTNYVDVDFPETYGLIPALGRFLSADFSTDSACMVINETAVKNFNMDIPLENRFIKPGGTPLGENIFLQVVGVVKDFHYESLHSPILPYAMVLRPPERAYVPYLTIKMDPNNIRTSMKEIEKVWDRFTNDQPFQYFFVDEDFSKRYAEEARTRTIFLIFSILAVFIACLGLLGLTAYSTEQRTKEIGIRKAMGASIPVIVRLISKETLVLVGVAALIAWPVAWYFTKNWLEGFAYRIELNALPFILSFLISLVIAFVTVSILAFNAALRNPSDSLRYE